MNKQQQENLQKLRTAMAKRAPSGVNMNDADTCAFPTYNVIFGPTTEFSDALGLNFQDSGYIFGIGFGNNWYDEAHGSKGIAEFDSRCENVLQYHLSTDEAE